VDDALKTRGIICLNVETSLLFAPPSKFLATCLGVTQALSPSEEKCVSNIRPFMTKQRTLFGCGYLQRAQKVTGSWYQTATAAELALAPNNIVFAKFVQQP